MTTAISYPNAADVSADDYIAIGLATCFVKDEGEVHEVQIIEPIPSAALEAIAKGVPTSYQMVWATTLGTVLVGETPQQPAEFPSTAQFGDEFAARTIAAARTYKRRQVATTLIPVGTVRNDFKYSTERKRLLNSDRIVTNADNVKQHAYTHEVL